MLATAESTHRPDVVQLPVEDAHGLNLREALQAAPVLQRCMVGHCLLHLRQVEPQLEQPAEQLGRSGHLWKHLQGKSVDQSHSWTRLQGHTGDGLMLLDDGSHEGCVW